MRAYSGIKQSGIVFLLLIALLLSLTSSGSAAEQNFTDLSSGNADYPYIKFLVDSGVINGYGDGTFRPGARLSRAEMAVLMVRANGLDTSSLPPAPHYKDVSPIFWGYASIEAATRAGYLKGYADGTFRPHEPVSRAEAAAIILRMTSTPLPAVELPSEVQDVSADHWARRIAAVAIDSAIMPLATKTGFAPDIPASRAEAARGIAIMLNVMPEKAHVPLTGTLFPVEGKVTLTVNGVSREISAPASCTAGCLVSTGKNSAAEIRFADGSGLKLKADTNISIKAARGQATILKNGSPGALIDNLEIGLTQGQILGALATTYSNEDIGEDETAAQTRPLAGKGRYSHAVASADEADVLRLAAKTQNASLPWYKDSYKKKVRVKVDMPWGVAAVRGTFWMNLVSSQGQSTSVIEGSVQVSSGGQSVSVQAGQGTQQISAGQPPAPPQPLTPPQQQGFVQEQSWILERATTIEQSAPVVAAPPTVQQQVQQAPVQATVPPPPQQAAPTPAPSAPSPAQPAVGPTQQGTPAPGQTSQSGLANNLGSLASQIIGSISQVLGTSIGSTPTNPNSTPATPSTSHESSGGSGNLPVSAIAVTGAGNANTVVNGQTLQMSATITPANATNRTVIWSVTNGTGSAAIDAATGLLSAAGNGTVTVKATAQDGSGVFGEKIITVVEAGQTTFTAGSASYTLRGVETPMDTAPIALSGNVLVPVRYLGEALEIDSDHVTWDAATQVVSLIKGDKHIQLTIGSNTLLVNNVPVTMNVAPQINNGRTYLPAKWVGEAFGYTVLSDGGSTLTIFTPLISSVNAVNSKVTLAFHKTISEAHIDTASNWVPVVTFADNTSYKLSILDANENYSMCLHSVRYTAGTNTMQIITPGAQPGVQYHMTVYKGAEYTQVETTKTFTFLEDTLPPEFMTGYPRVENIECSTADLTIQTHETGTAYYVALLTDELSQHPDYVPATADTVKNWNADSYSQLSSWSGSMDLYGDPAVRTVDHLRDNSSYKMYVVAEDHYNNLTPVTIIEFQTPQESIEPPPYPDAGDFYVTNTGGDAAPILTIYLNDELPFGTYKLRSSSGGQVISSFEYASGVEPLWNCTNYGQVDGIKRLIYTYTPVNGTEGAQIDDGAMPVAPTAAVIEAGDYNNANYITLASRDTVRVRAAAAFVPGNLVYADLQDEHGHVSQSPEPAASDNSNYIISMASAGHFTDGDDVSVRVHIKDSNGNWSGYFYGVTGQADFTVPTASIISDTCAVGNDVTARSTEIGTLYLVPDSAVIGSQSEAETAVTGGIAAKATVTAADTDMNISTANLAPGFYKIVAVDAAGNLCPTQPFEICSSQTGGGGGDGPDPIAADNIFVINNLPPNSDIISVNGLAAGESVRVYAENAAAVPIYESVTVDAGYDGVIMYDLDLDNSGGRIWLSRVCGEQESSRQECWVSPVGAQHDAPSPENIRVFNRLESEDEIEVTGLNPGDRILLYDRELINDNYAYLPIEISVPVAANDNTISFTGLDLDPEGGCVYVSAVSMVTCESDKIEVEYSPELIISTLGYPPYHSMSEILQCTVISLDANSDPVNQDTISVNINSDSDAAGINLTACETDVDSGVFTVTVQAGSTSNAAAAVIKAVVGDRVRFTYMPDEYNSVNTYVTMTKFAALAPQVLSETYTGDILVNCPGASFDQDSTSLTMYNDDLLDITTDAALTILNAEQATIIFEQAAGLEAGRYIVKLTTGDEVVIGYVFIGQDNYDPQIAGISSTVVGPRQLRLDVNLNEAGKVYYAVLPYTAAIPDLQDIVSACAQPLLTTCVNSIDTASGIITLPENDVPYDIYVAAADIFDNYQYCVSCLANAMVPLDTDPPSQPSDLGAAAQGQAITISWNYSADNVGVVSYKVYMSSTYDGIYAEAGSTDGETTMLTITGLSPDSTVYLYVTALDAAGNESAPSAVVSVVSGGVPNLPAAFYGTVKDQTGTLIAEGTIEVVVDGVVRASKSFTNGVFGSSLGDRLIVDTKYFGNTCAIVFKVNGYTAEADPAVDWSNASGNLIELNLVACMDIT